MRNVLVNMLTLYSDGATGAITRVVSFPAPLDRRNSSTSKFVSAPALAFNLKNVQKYLISTRKTTIIVNAKM